jgi:hypothetical protein
MLDYMDCSVISTLSDRGGGQIIAMLFKDRFLAAVILYDDTAIIVTILYNRSRVIVAILMNFGIVAAAGLKNICVVFVTDLLGGGLVDECLVAAVALRDDGDVRAA